MRELIIYLEPPVGLKQTIQSFLDDSRDKFGWTTANKYNCHVSMSGFFTVTEPDRVLECIQSTLPKAHTILIDMKPLLVDNHHLLLPITAPPSLHTMMTQVADQCQDIAHIRIKKINHISLAYWDDNTHDEAILKQITKQATSYFSNLCQEEGVWDIVLYERTKKSQAITEVHQFRELKRWPLSC